MLYRLRPPSDLMYADVPSGFLKANLQADLDLDRLAWEPAEAREFSRDLLRLGLRYGTPCPSGIVLDIRHTLELGRGDMLRVGQQGIDEMNASTAPEAEVVERVFPGWIAAGDELNER